MLPPNAKDKLKLYGETGKASIKTEGEGLKVKRREPWSADRGGKAFALASPRDGWGEGKGARWYGGTIAGGNQVLVVIGLMEIGRMEELRNI